MIESNTVNTAGEAFLRGVHRPDHDYRMALYDSFADLNRFTTSYTDIGEVRGPGYEAGGRPLLHLVTGTNAEGHGWLSWLIGPSWKNANFITHGALIYNNSHPDKPALATIKFAQPWVGKATDELVVYMPPPNAEQAMIGLYPETNGTGPV